MPITKKGAKVKKAMEKQYGKEKGKQVFFASIVKGKKGSSKWHGKGSGKLEKAKRTFAKKKSKIKNRYGRKIT
jgi:hypothetical protein